MERGVELRTPEDEELVALGLVKAFSSRKYKQKQTSIYPFLMGKFKIYIHTIPYHNIPYHTIPYHTIPYHTIPYHTIPYHTIPYHTTID